MSENSNKLHLLRACMLSHFSCVRLFRTLWTVAHQAPLPMGFSKQAYRNGLSSPPPGDLSDSGIKCNSLYLLHWQADSLLLVPPGKPQTTSLTLSPKCINTVYKQQFLGFKNETFSSKYLHVGRLILLLAKSLIKYEDIIMFQLTR